MAKRTSHLPPALHSREALEVQIDLPHNRDGWVNVDPRMKEAFDRALGREDHEGDDEDQEPRS